MKTKRALVTGATGFIGNHLVRELRCQGWAVICLTRNPLRAEDTGIECLAADLFRPESLIPIRPRLAGVDVVFHLAAQLPVVQPPVDESVYFKVNARATFQLLRLAVDAGVGSFVYLSSIGVIGRPEILPIHENHPARPEHPYFVSKLCAELYCEWVRSTENIRATSLRVVSPYGPAMPDGPVLAKFVRQALKSEDIFLHGTGERRQNFVHVRDVVQASLLAAETSHPGVYNVASGSSVSMRHLAEMILRLTPGSRSSVRASGKPDPQEGYHWDIDLSRSQNRLGYLPGVSLDAGLKEYLESARNDVPPSRWWKQDYENSAAGGHSR